MSEKPLEKAPGQIGDRPYWTEREGIAVDHISYGDVSGWSRATSKPFGSQFKPKRPEVETPRLASLKVRKLSDIKPMPERTNGPEPVAGLCFNRAKAKVDLTNEDVRVAWQAGKAKKAMDIAAGFERMFRGLVKRKKGKQATLPEKAQFRSILDDCPTVNVSEIKAQEVPRESVEVWKEPTRERKAWK